MSKDLADKQQQTTTNLMTNAELAKRDYLLLIDRSGSMSYPGTTGKSKWEEAQEMTIALAKACEEFDADGISVYLFNDGFQEYKNIKSGGDQVKRMFTENKPMGGTNTHLVLKKVFDNYFANPTKPITVLVVTDGEPNDQRAVKTVIIEATKKMNADEEIGVSFLQIGNDKSCRDFLKELDDELQKQGAKFDIVDTRDNEEMAKFSNYTEVLIAAVSD